MRIVIGIVLSLLVHTAFANNELTALLGCHQLLDDLTHVTGTRAVKSVGAKESLVFMDYLQVPGAKEPGFYLFGDGSVHFFAYGEPKNVKEGDRNFTHRIHAMIPSTSLSKPDSRLDLAIETAGQWPGWPTEKLQAVTSLRASRGGFASRVNATTVVGKQVMDEEVLDAFRKKLMAAVPRAEKVDTVKFGKNIDEAIQNYENCGRASAPELKFLAKKWASTLDGKKEREALIARFPGNPGLVTPVRFENHQ